MLMQKVILSNYTSLKVGGECDMVKIHTLDDLKEAAQYAIKNKLKLHILGLGTNTYFDEHLPNTLIAKIQIKGIEIVEQDQNSVIIRAAAGEIWDNIVKLAVSKGLWGIENLSYIPGTMGAAPVQNIGAYGSELSDSLIMVEVFDLLDQKVKIISAKDCKLGYRESIFKSKENKYIILYVYLNLSKEYKPTLTYSPLNTLDKSKTYKLEEIRNIIIQTRKDKIPNYNEYPNAGSFFKNPVIDKKEAEYLKKLYDDAIMYEINNKYKVPAAWLIENVANMKGLRVGDVGIYDKQPLILINYDKAKAKDINDLAENIIKTVKDRVGIVLEKEVNYIKTHKSLIL
jgi:UDP-N-acetylmuramate dehydrogenase